MIEYVAQTFSLAESSTPNETKQTSRPSSPGEIKTPPHPLVTLELCLGRGRTRVGQDRADRKMKEITEDYMKTDPDSVPRAL